MSKTVANDAFLAFSKIQSLLKDGYHSEEPVHYQIDEFEYDNDINASALNENNLVSPADLVRSNVNSELFPSSLQSSENLFQEMLQDCMKKYSDCIAGVVVSDNVQNAEIANRFSISVGKRYFELDRKADSVKNTDPQLQREVAQEKAERDLWSLLDILSRSNLMDDIDDEQCEANLQSVISSLPVTASIPDFINAAYLHDQRIRKGAVLKEWIERAAADKVEVAAAPHAIPGSETLSRILKDANSRSSHKNTKQNDATLVQSMHPDAQITADGLMLSLDSLDRFDQEALLKSIFALIRSGQILKAQQLAAEHRVFWLAASLQGIASHYHKTIEVPDQDVDENAMNQDSTSNIVGIARIGNPKLPIWTRTCWKHASRLSGNSGNWNAQVREDIRNYDDLFSVGRDSSLVGTLECSIYAALSNNTKVLLESPVLTSWHDRVWVLLKAAHERDISKVIHRYRCLKSAHSSLYPGCDVAVIAAERELLDLSKHEIGHMSTGNCTQIFNKVSPPSVKNAESILLTLQAAVMEGKSGIANFIDRTIVPILSSKHSESVIQGSAMVLRVFCHFAIWLKYSPTNGPLSDLVADEVLYLAVEQYINYLIETKQYTLIAAYATYLNRPRRIAKYCELLRVIRTSADEAAKPDEVHEPSGQSAEAAEVLQLATIFFPLDVMDITRSVVEGTQLVVIPRSTIAVAHTSAPSTPHGNGRTVHFSETEASPQATKSVFFGTPSVADALPSTPLTTTELFAKIKERRATPGILRSHVEEPESPSIMSHHKIPPSPVVSSLSGNAEENQEIVQMESLRWLFFDPTHRLEAVKQTNKLITNFLTESSCSKLSQVRLLLTEYLPYNSVTVGYTLLKQRLMNTEDTIAEYVTRHPEGLEQSDAFINQLRDSIQLDQLCWEANVCKLELWKSFIGAMENFDAFKNLLLEYSSAASRIVGNNVILRSSLGKYRSKIEQAATVAVEALNRTIVCSPYSTDYENPADGYKDVWMKSDSAIMSSVIHIIHDLSNLVKNYQPSRLSNEDNTNAVHKIREEVEEVLYLSKNLFADHDEPQFKEICDMINILPTCVGDCPHNDSDCLLKVSTAVNQVKLNLMDYKESLYLRCVLIHKLLTAYLQVCMECGTVMETLEHPQEASIWYYKAVKLANLIASEDHSLQLETLLHRSDLESLLSTINKASIKVLKIDPEFNVV